MSGVTDKTYAIHPALGIARMGNATADPTDTSSFYLGAESPYQVPNQGQPYKTAGKIKKQAQRFRIYEFQGGQATREITLQEEDVAAIEWTVHLANRKAALDTALQAGTPSKPAAVPPKPWGLDAEPDDGADPHYWPANTRNAGVSKDGRVKLCIDAGPQSVGGGASERDLSGTITFFSGDQPKTRTVQLGRLCTEDNTGRLLVFAGNGLSAGLDKNGTFSPNAPLPDWGNNDAWYDNTADGPVQASITFRDGTRITLNQPEQSAWVIGAAPRFSPAMGWITTLHHVASNAVGSEIPTKPSFAKHIYPILRCASRLQWVSVRASAGHSSGGPGYYLSEQMMNLLSDNNPSKDSDPYKARNRVFGRVRNPNQEYVKRETVQHFMPQVSGDITRNTKGDYDVASLTPLQYAIFKKWRDGDFESDGIPKYVPLDQMDVASQPSALDHAALEGTAGTPFYPGIESWRIMRSPDLYAGSSPLRMAGSTQPGDLTMGNALPWQADFLDCNDIWWPVQRPNEVTRDGNPLQPWAPVAWMPAEAKPDYNKMVEGWWQLGFVVPARNGALFEEVEGNAVEDPGA